MKNLCYRQKAMHDMEYTSFIINIVLGFICADLAFLHYLGYGKEAASSADICLDADDIHDNIIVSYIINNYWWWY